MAFEFITNNLAMVSSEITKFKERCEVFDNLEKAADLNEKLDDALGVFFKIDELFLFTVSDLLQEIRIE